MVPMKSLENYRFFDVFRGIEIRLNSLDISSESGDDPLGTLEKKLNIGLETGCYLVLKFPSIYHSDYPLFLPRPTNNLLNTLWTKSVINKIFLACQPFSKVFHLQSTKELGSGLKNTAHRHPSRVDWEQHRFAPIMLPKWVKHDLTLKPIFHPYSD